MTLPVVLQRKTTSPQAIKRHVSADRKRSAVGGSVTRPYNGGAFLR